MTWFPLNLFWITVGICSFAQFRCLLPRWPSPSALSSVVDAEIGRVPPLFFIGNGHRRRSVGQRTKVSTFLRGLFRLTKNVLPSFSLLVFCLRLFSFFLVLAEYAFRRPLDARSRKDRSEAFELDLQAITKDIEGVTIM